VADNPIEEWMFASCMQSALDLVLRHIAERDRAEAATVFARIEELFDTVVAAEIDHYNRRGSAKAFPDEREHIEALHRRLRMAYVTLYATIMGRSDG